MKKISMLLVMALLLSLCACGGEAAVVSGGESAVSNAEAAVPVEAAATDGGYIIPASWTEDSMNDGTWGYVTAAADLPEGNYSIRDGFLVSQETEEGVSVTITRCTLDGTELCHVTVPTEEASDNVYQYVGYYAFGEDAIYLEKDTHRVIDEETGETESEFMLQTWDYDGTMRCEISAEEALGIDTEEDFIVGITIGPDGQIVVTTLNTMFFCDDQWNVLASCPLESNGLRITSDREGRLYLDDVFENQVYTIDWDSCALGDPLFTTSGMETVIPGGGDYDFYLASETLLRGVNLSTGTITEILSWADWNLTGSVGGVAYLDEETFLLTTYNLLTQSQTLLTLSRVPADDIPEKTVVRLAVPLGEEQAAWGATWADNLDQMVAAAMNQFNLESDTYRVEVETYSSAQELQLKITAGDAPDLIYWDRGMLEDVPSSEIFAKRGYLVDLTDYFHSDPELSLDDFIPNILSLVQARYGGKLYSMALDFYPLSVMAQLPYVEGYDTSWTISDLLSIAETLPEDMCVMEYITQKGFLSVMLEYDISHFVDMDALTCNFETQEFYDLLTLCRDYFPTEIGEGYMPPAGGPLLSGEGFMGRFGQIASDVLRPMADQGKVLLGYPGVGGSGLGITFYQEMSICALGSQPEGAWQFLRELYSYDFQFNNGSAFHSVRLDVFNDREDRYLVVNGSCTEEESLAARKLAFGATVLRTFTSPAVPIIQEEAEAFFAGDRSAEDTARIIQSRVGIYLGEIG